MRIRQATRGRPRRIAAAKRGTAGRTARRLGAYGVLCAAVLAGLYLGWTALGHWPALALKTVEVRGAHRVGRAEVIRLSGARPGMNLLALDPGAMARAVEAQPWIRRAAVRRVFPDRLVLTLEERTPVALVNLDGIRLVDADGVVFKALEPGDPSDLPLISGLSADPGRPGRLPSKGLRALRLIAMAGRGERVLSARNIAQIHFEKDGRMVVYTADAAVPIAFGDGDLRREFRKAEAVLYQVYRSGRYHRVARIELDYSNQAAWARLKEAGDLVRAPE
ncbi:FtsQ-type POTRA domain-containing protein [Dissulfurirhabdus thermomarina]|uniref:Cell division protein FtsQ n=1 Tax=Dissulfurirhabdus thermomarina TaxID=1765737 RepID=A0A6N9TNK6_DISTH|nr:FtsQ-type POTRA domain-containing protein [Dissulfurirhabdus thermomarina]NDY42835.1 FtsQ-type POTRA domain-containing protein [Dissulfurirhabdus thermomarina]